MPAERPAAGRPAALPTQLLAGLAIALAAGVAIGWMDSRPGWDDTGITAVALVVAGAVGALVAQRRPWLIALAAGVWVPAFELASLASGGPLLALAFAGVGAAVGWLGARG